MAKQRNKTNQPYKKGVVTKTTAEKPSNVVVSEFNVVSTDRSRKDIGDYVTALQGAESVWNPNRVALYNLYERALLDGHLTGILRKRWDAVINKVIYFVDASGKKVDPFDTLIESDRFIELCKYFLEGQAWGISGVEFPAGETFDWVEVPRKHIKPEKGLVTIEQYGDVGYTYADIPNMYIVGNKKDLGFLLQCTPYTIYKQANWGDWSQYIEIFGQPVRVIYYDAYDTKTKMELKQVLDESGSSLALMIPKQAQFEMKDGKQSNGDGKLQGSFREALNEELSIIVLGNTETTSSSRSSGYAQSKEHGKQQLEITKSDIQYLKSKLNNPKFLGILKSFGFPVDGGRFVFKKELDLEALKTRWEIDKDLGNKIPVEDDYYYDTYGIPKPENYDELKAKLEEEKAAAAQVLKKQSPAAEDPEEETATEGKPPVKKKAPVKKDLKAQVYNSNWFRVRAFLADFFDHAP